MHQQTGEIIPQPTIQEPLRSGATRIRTICISLASLLILVVASFVSYAGIIHPIQLHAQATSVVNDLQTAQVQSSPQYVYNLVTHQTPTLDDSLDSQHGAWTANQECVFTKGAYHALTNPSTTTGAVCLNEDHNYRDFIYQVQMTFIQGPVGGIVFHTINNLHLYSFSITNNGLYFVTLISGIGGRPLSYGRSLSIKSGTNQPNLLAVLAHGSTFSFFVNRQYITSVNDTTYTSGEIGCVAASPTQDNFDVAFSNAQVWSL